jgi:hypothetical protein
VAGLPVQASGIPDRVKSDEDPSVLLAAGGLGLAASFAVEAQPETGSAQPPRGNASSLPRSTASPRSTATPVHVKVSASQVYELELFGDCPDVDWEQRIAIRSTGGSNWVCRGLDAELIVPSPIGPTRCPVSTIRRLSDEEVQAWRESRRRN